MTIMSALAPKVARAMGKKPLFKRHMATASPAHRMRWKTKCRSDSDGSVIT